MRKPGVVGLATLGVAMRLLTAQLSADQTLQRGASHVVGITEAAATMPQIASTSTPHTQPPQPEDAERQAQPSVMASQHTELAVPVTDAEITPSRSTRSDRQGTGSPGSTSILRGAPAWKPVKDGGSLAGNDSSLASSTISLGSMCHAALQS